MDAKLFGTVDRPAAILVGTWDPFLPAYRGILRQLVRHTREKGQAPVAVLLDPPPQTFFKGPAHYSVYTGPRARVQRLLAEGMDGVLRIDFSKPDLDLGAYDLLNLVRSHIPLAEVWMRPDQTFGRAARGSLFALALYAKKHGLIWKSLAPIQVKLTAGQVQLALQEGRVVPARAIVGLPPVWERPDSGELRLAWKPGVYEAVPLREPDDKLTGDTVIVELRPDADGMSSLSWPRPDVEYLAFVRGPGDSAAEQRSVAPVALPGYGRVTA